MSPYSVSRVDKSRGHWGRMGEGPRETEIPSAKHCIIASLSIPYLGLPKKSRGQICEAYLVTPEAPWPFGGSIPRVLQDSPGPLTTV
jgi:hypothetical protein